MYYLSLGTLEVGTSFLIGSSFYVETSLDIMLHRSSFKFPCSSVECSTIPTSPQVLLLAYLSLLLRSWKSTCLDVINHFMLLDLKQGAAPDHK